MKKIGLVDYFIDEWHSNNYIGWIDDICKESDFDCKVTYAWAEADEYEGKLSTDEWCEKYGITKCNSIEELCEKSDYIMILSPGNPEKHLEYAKKVLPFNKNTYIDKTFAPDLKTAKEIFELSEKTGTKIFSTSALRYASELEEFDNPNGMLITGGGRSLEEYIIHQIEMLVKKMGIGAKSVKEYKTGKQTMCVVKYADGRNSFMFYSETADFHINAEDSDGKTKNLNIASDFFITLLKNILNFFENDVVAVPSEQTLEVIAIRDAVIKAAQHCEQWIDIEK